MIKNYFQKYGTKIVSKMAKYILVLLIAGVTWVVAISPSMYKRGEQLYEQGKLFYNEEKLQVLLPCFIKRIVTVLS